MQWISKDWKEYEVLDATQGDRLESWCGKILVRPDPQVIWATERKDPRWSRFDARYLRSNTGGGRWDIRSLPESWLLHYKDYLTFHVKPMNFKHTGVFPEQAANWDYIREKVRAAGRPVRILNLFAYSGGATLACAKAGAQVCHLDASRKMTDWARENARLNHLEEAPIRWIVDDVTKFLKRELRRGRRYDGIILDPPSFGRGTSQELFQIDECMQELLGLCREILSPHPLFLLLTCHTPGYTPLVLSHLATQSLPTGRLRSGEMTLPTDEAGRLAVPCGAYAFWTP